MAAGQGYRCRRPAFAGYIRQLEEASGIRIRTFEDLKAALTNRMEYFNSRGCRVSDHGLDYVMYAPAPDAEIEAIFQKGLSGVTPTPAETARYKAATDRIPVGLLHVLTDFAPDAKSFCSKCKVLG